MADVLSGMLGYDPDYLRGGCVGDPPPDTDGDNMFATYASNYAIAVAALAGALVLAFNGRAATVYRVLGVGFFLFTGAGYGLAGFTHQFQQPTDTLALVAFALTLVGMVFMFMLMNEVAKTRWACCTPCIMRSAQGFAVVSGLAILAVYFLPAASTRLALNITGVHAGLVMLYCLAVWGSGCEIPRVIAALSMIAGYLVQVILTPKCGTPAYRDCFKDCPLPAPTFNHNALFHVLFFIGVTILAVVMNRRPGVAKAEDFSLVSDVDLVTKLPEIEDGDEELKRRGLTCCGAC